MLDYSNSHDPIKKTMVTEGHTNKLDLHVDVKGRYT